MPSNKELVKNINALAAELDVEADTQGLSNQQLAAMLEDLQLQQRIKAGEIDAETLKAPGYYVASKCAITTRRGILAEGEAITEEDLAGGLEALQAFVKKKKVVRVTE